MSATVASFSPRYLSRKSSRDKEMFSYRKFPDYTATLTFGEEENSFTYSFFGTGAE
jgi:hypothetical protein